MVLYGKLQARPPPAWWLSTTIKRAFFHLFYRLWEHSWGNTTPQPLVFFFFPPKASFLSLTSKIKERKKKGYDYYSNNILAVEATSALQINMAKFEVFVFSSALFFLIYQLQDK